MSGKTAFVTEGASIYGREICAALAKKGYAVVFTYSGEKDAAEALVGEIGTIGSSARAHPVRAFTAEELSAAAVDAAEAYEGIDLLLYLANTSSPFHADGKMLLDQDEEDWDESMHRGARGFFLLCKYTLPYLIGRNAPRILTVDAGQLECGDCSLTDYVSGKALEATSDHLRVELSHYGIPLVNKKISDSVSWMDDVLEDIE